MFFYFGKIKKSAIISIIKKRGDYMQNIPIYPNKITREYKSGVESVVYYYEDENIYLNGATTFTINKDTSIVEHHFVEKGPFHFNKP